MKAKVLAFLLSIVLLFNLSALSHAAEADFMDDPVSSVGGSAPIGGDEPVEGAALLGDEDTSDEIENSEEREENESENENENENIDPADPNNPDNPDNPANPEDPDNFDTPEDPNNPDNPDNPDDPDPNNPADTADPSDPDNPGDPENPDNPDNPDNLDEPIEDVAPLGDEDHIVPLFETLAPSALLMEMSADDSITFADPKLDEYIRKTYGGGDRISKSTAETITVLDISGLEIGSLAGIEHFIHLVSLDCSNNDLTALDISKNFELETLIASHNSITLLAAQINLTNNKQLKHLDLSHNKISGSLYMNENILLAYADLSHNQFSSIGFTQNSELLYINIENNRIRIANVTGNPRLKELYAANNVMTHIDLSKNTALMKLDVSDNQLTELDITNSPALETVKISINRLLTAFDISQNPALRHIDCHNNYMPSSEEAKLRNTAVHDFVCIFNPQINNDLVTLSYDNNGAPGVRVPPNYTAIKGSSVLLAGNADDLKRDGYIFTGWNSNSDGSGTNYYVPIDREPNYYYLADRIILNSDTTLYANWLKLHEVERISIPDTLELRIGAHASLSLTFFPETADPPPIEWSSTDPAVATVSAEGMVTGHKAGRATIIATAQDTLRDNVADSCEVNVVNIIPVSGISIIKDEISLRIDESERLQAAVIPANASDKTIIWSPKTAADGQVVAVENGIVRGRRVGTATVTAQTVCGSYTGEVQVHVGGKLATSISLLPAHQAVKAGERAAVDLSILPITYDETDTNITWSINGKTLTDADPNFILEQNTLKSRDSAGPGSYRISVSGRGSLANGSEGIISASAVVEIYAADTDNWTTPRLLDTTVILNPAREGSQGVNIQIVGSQLFDEIRHDKDTRVKLYTDYHNAAKKREITGPGGDISARLAADFRSVEIEAGLSEKARVINKVTLVMVDGSGKEVALEGLLRLTIRYSYPKINITTDRALSTYYTGRPATLVATSSEGAVTINQVAPVTPIAAGSPTVGYGNTLQIPTSGQRGGNFRFNVDLTVEGYKAVSKNGNRIIATIKVTNETPRVKLSQNSLVMDSTRSNRTGVRLNILPRDAKQQISDWGSIDRVELYDESNTILFIESSDLLFNRSRNEIILPQFGNGTVGIKNYRIRVYFRSGPNGEGEAGAPVALALRIRWVDASKNRTKLGASRTTYTVNTKHVGDIATVEITHPIHNIIERDFEIVRGELPPGIGMMVGANSLTFYANGAEIRASEGAETGKRSIDINAKDASGKLRYSNIRFTFSIVNKKETFSLTPRGRIDISDPGRTLAVSARLANTAARVSAVELYTSSAFGEQSTLFEVVEMVEGTNIADNVFHIRISGKALKTGRATQKLYVKLYLDNQAPADALTSNKALSIKPIQTVARAKVSRNELSLFTERPGEKGMLSLSLASALSQIPGDVRIAPASSNSRLNFAEGGFELTRMDADRWALGFVDGALPRHPSDKKGRIRPLRSSYNLTLELWPTGSFSHDKDGNIIPFHKSRSSNIRIRVNIR